MHCSKWLQTLVAKLFFSGSVRVDKVDMHGLIHVVFRGFVVDTFGEVAWKEVLKRAGVEDEATILEMKHYDDALTMAAVKIGAEVAGAPLEAALELFGAYFVDFAAGAGFIRLLRSLGSNLHETLGNLNLNAIQPTFLHLLPNYHFLIYKPLRCRCCGGLRNILHHNVERDLPAAIFPIFEVGSLEWINDQKLGRCSTECAAVVYIVLQSEKV